jgi:hypothetical protein
MEIVLQTKQFLNPGVSNIAICKPHFGYVIPHIGQGSHLDANAEVTVPPSMLRATLHRVGAGELHEVDHLRAHPEPGPSIRQLVVRPVIVELQP